jgi:putative transposase
MARSPRYPPDPSDEEWARIEPLLPPRSKDGHPEKHNRRDIVNAILCVTHNVIVWRALPADFPPWKTVYNMFDQWRKKGVDIKVNTALRDEIRQAEGRAAEPTAAVIYSQSVKGAQTVAAPRVATTPAKRSTGASDRPVA